MKAEELVSEEKLEHRMLEWWMEHFDAAPSRRFTNRDVEAAYRAGACAMLEELGIVRVAEVALASSFDHKWIAEVHEHILEGAILVRPTKSA